MDLKFSLTLLAGLACATSQAQLVVSEAMTPTQLVENVLLGGGVTVSNVRYNGMAAPATPQDGSGSFTLAGGDGLGLDAGVILASGYASSAEGPASNQSSDQSSENGDDPDLEAIVNGPITDHAILEFDFVPTGDTLRFRYVFGSEEYPEFVCQYNDAFGFFLSGPGISGPFLGGAVNIAVLPDGVTPVTIDNVNYGLNNDPQDPSCPAANPDYYVNNEFGTAVAYDGLTTVLTAFALVQCGQQYHIKLAIADAGLDFDSDTGFDSGVFLEAGSFTSTGQVQPTIAGGVGVDGNTMMEGCGPFQLVFTRVGQLQDPATVTLNVTGTATPGVDYSPAFPTELYFAPDVETLVFDLDVPPDADGEETMILQVEQLIQCAGMVIETEFTFIIDSPDPLNIAIDDIDGVCGDVHELAPVVTGGVGAYTYTWNTGETTLDLTVSPAVTTTYSLTVTDGCAVEPLTEDVTVTLPVYLPLEIEVSPPTQIACLELGPISVTSATGGNGVYTYEWTLAGNAVGNTATIDVPGGAPVHYIVTVDEGCGTSVQDSVLVSAVPLEPIVVSTTGDVTVICAGDSTLMEVTGVTGGNGIYTYAWRDDAGIVLATTTSLEVGVPVDHTYTITATDQCGNEGVAEIDTYEPVYAPFQLTTTEDRVICAGDSLTVQATVTGGSGLYFIDWQDLGVTDPILKVAPLQETAYLVTVTDQCGEVLADMTVIDVEHVDVDIETTSRGEDDWYLQAATLPYALTWVWDMGDGTRYRTHEATHSYMDLDEHWATLYITTPNGCAGVDSVLLRPPGHLYFPSAFTPDGDGINDEWGPKGHYMDDFEMTVYDRWGEAVFTSTDMMVPWDGKINGSGQVISGVYVYKYKAVGHLFPNAEGFGHVTLLTGSQPK